MIWTAISLVIVVAARETAIHLPSPVRAYDNSIEDQFDEPPRSFREIYRKADICVDYTITTYHENRILQTGPVPNGFVNRPATISPCELEQLHTDCVAQLNKYRDGTLKFRDGTNDDNVLSGLRPLTQRKGTNACASGGALGDLIANVAGAGGCDGAHDNAFVCPRSGLVAQNSCCARGGGSFGSRQVIDTAAEVRAELFSCLQQMWDEGITPGEKGHWETMRSKDFTHATCGFAFTTNGRVMMTQDFYTSEATCVPSCSACDQTTCSLPCICPAGAPASASSSQSVAASPEPSPVGGTGAGGGSTGSGGGSGGGGGNGAAVGAGIGVTLAVLGGVAAVVFWRRKRNGVQPKPAAARSVLAQEISHQPPTAKATAAKPTPAPRPPKPQAPPHANKPPLPAPGVASLRAKFQN